MSLYGTTQIRSMEEMAKDPAIVEMMLVDDLLHNSSDQIKEFCESTEAKVLTEKAVLNKKTIVRLNKQDDAKRRTKLMCYQLAKEAGDPEWKKLVTYTQKRKASIAKIMQKYSPKAERLAKISQKEYIAAAKKAGTSQVVSGSVK